MGKGRIFYAPPKRGMREFTTVNEFLTYVSDNSEGRIVFWATHGNMEPRKIGLTTRMTPVVRTILTAVCNEVVARFHDVLPATEYHDRDQLLPCFASSLGVHLVQTPSEVTLEMLERANEMFKH